MKIGRMLLADRYCYLVEGEDGLRKRHGMQRAYFEEKKLYWDKYDTQALETIRNKKKEQEEKS